MALSTDHIPMSRSLQERVEELFAPDDRSEPRNPLSRRDICGYLAKSKDTDGSPLATIRRRASKQNRSPELKPQHHAALAWVCDAFSEWEDNYSLETPLRDQIRRLLPLAVAMAISDDAFFTPGAHPLHQLLDAIQSGAVGWQVRLDRAGQMLEQRVERSIEKALEWFNNDRVDISAITRELVSANERDAARAQRMVQRLEETEQARLKTLTAKRAAAELINSGLKQYQLPSAIGEFVKGAWYDSAQMVLVKFGDDSREWEQMSRATLHLMQSVQPLDDSSDTDRDRQSQILRHLPGQLRRWLISLEHDSDATDSAIGLVEYAHLRIQHGQVLDLAQVPLIPIEELGGGPETSPDEFESGEWYLFEDDEGELRAQLVLQLERGHHLLFTNFVGLKALDLSRLVFSQRLADGFATALPNRDTFSLSLAAAAGIDNNDKLRKFLDPSYEPEPWRTQNSGLGPGVLSMRKSPTLIWTLMMGLQVSGMVLILAPTLTTIRCWHHQRVLKFMEIPLRHLDRRRAPQLPRPAQRVRQRGRPATVLRKHHLRSHRPNLRLQPARSTDRPRQRERRSHLRRRREPPGRQRQTTTALSMHRRRSHNRQRRAVGPSLHHQRKHHLQRQARLHLEHLTARERLAHSTEEPLTQVLMVLEVPHQWVAQAGRLHQHRDMVGRQLTRRQHPHQRHPCHRRLPLLR